jgi:hypothetical protein
VDRVVYSVQCFVVEFEAMLFLAMVLDQRHDFLFAVAAYLPITVPCQHIRAVELEAWVLLLELRIHIVLLRPSSSHSRPEAIPLSPDGLTG